MTFPVLRDHCSRGTGSSRRGQPARNAVGEGCRQPVAPPWCWGLHDRRGGSVQGLAVCVALIRRTQFRAAAEIAHAALPWIAGSGVLRSAGGLLISLARQRVGCADVQDAMRPLRYALIGSRASAVLPDARLRMVRCSPAGVGGSAVANLAGFSWLGGFFIGFVGGEGVPVVDLPVLRAQIRMGQDPVLRTMAFQVCFVLPAPVAARFDPPRWRPNSWLQL